MELVNRYFEKLTPVPPKTIPERLVHYTTVPGAQGILNTNRLWSTDARYLNDSTELTYGIEVGREALSRAFSAAGDARIAAMRDVAPTLLDPTVFRSRVPYVTCFCEEPDLLSQWRGYSATASPISIAFDLRAKVASDSLPRASRLGQVIYNRTDQESSAQNLFNKWVSTITPQLDLWSEQPLLAVRVLEASLLELVLLFKHSAFSEEREWRLITPFDPTALALELGNSDRAAIVMSHLPWSTSSDLPELRFRPSHLGLTPYIELDLAEKIGPSAGRLPLTEVMIGPSENASLAAQSMSLFLTVKGYSSAVTPVSTSAIPLRAQL